VSWAFHHFGKELTVIHPKKGKEINLWVPKRDQYKFQSGEFNYALPFPQSISIPIALDAICSAEELDCVIPNCTLKADR
jgi:hypothetical protein